MATDLNPFVALGGLIEKGLSKMGRRAEHRDVVSHIDYAHQKHMEAMDMQRQHDLTVMGAQHKQARKIIQEVHNQVAAFPGASSEVETTPEGGVKVKASTPAAKATKKASAKKTAPAAKKPTPRKKS